MKTIPITCRKCNASFKIKSSEYNRQLRNGRDYFFCSLSCAQSYNKTTTFRIVSTCVWCKRDFETSTHKKARRCCSLDCAHKYSQSKVDPETHRLSLQRKKHFPKEKQFICVICHRAFIKTVLSDSKHFQVCSPICCNELLRQKAISNPNCGGETGYRHYKYRDVWMDSAWEVNLAKWMDDNGIYWERSRKRHMFWWTDDDGQKRRYYPDFYLPDYDVYLDPKNKYRMKMDEYKLTKVVNENGIHLIWGEIENVKKEIDTLRRM